MADPHATRTPELSVLIPTHGRPEALRRLLQGLAAQTLAPERFEVIVVDDGSPKVLELAERFPFELVLLREKQAGPGAARNHGLARCRAEWLVILNDDAVPAPDLLERHLAARLEVPERCAVLGTFHFTAEALRRPFVRLLDQSNLLFTFNELAHGRVLDWGFFWTCNLGISAAALRAVGGFDAERFPEAIVEDVELGYRLAQQGWRVVHRADCRAEHDHVLTPEAYFRRGVKLGRYLTRMWRKHGDARIVWRASEADAEQAAIRSVSIFEAYRAAEPTLVAALQRLDEEYLDKPLPDALAARTIRMIGEVGMAAFHRGMHLESTGVDALEVIERGAPKGELTSVIVVSHDALAHTRRCIDALRAARDDAHPIEILVVDNGSKDGSAEWLRGEADLRLISNPRNYGAPRARNQALALARGAWVAFLDNDVFVPQGWLARALYHGAVDPGVGAIALVANRASKQQEVPYTGASDARSIASAADARYRDFARRGIDCELFTSLAVLVRRAVLERIGGFDERFSPWGFEDDDLALRVRRAGWRNRVALDTFVYHAPYREREKHRRHARLLRENWARFAAKWGHPSKACAVPELFDYAALELDAPERSEPELYVPLPAADAPAPIAFDEPAEPATSSACDAARRNLIVLGAGRSGTSLVAGTLAHAGWFPGDDPYAPRAANPKGFFECAEINGINEYLLAGALRSHPPLGPMQRWLAAASEPLRFDPPAELVERMRRLVARAPFAFKDPRFCYTLPAWRPVLGDARFVCVFRDPAASAESMVRECAEADYLKGVELDFERALEVWCAMYRAVLERHRHEGEWLFLHFDELLTPAGLARLEAFAGAPVARDFPDAKLSRSRGSGRDVGSAARRLYRELCALAGGPEQAPQEPAARACPEPLAPACKVRELAEPELSVLVCTYQRVATLQRCLASFERQSAAGRFELVVVNDGSTDGTREWLAGWRPRVPVRILERENGGLAAARNSGLAEVRGKYVLLVNDDTIAHPDLVAAHLAAHAEHGGGVAILGTFEQPPAALDNALMRVLEDDTLVFCYAQLEAGKRSDWNAFWTCNVSVASAAVRAVGGFDETFRHYGCEDTDLAYRLHREQGMEVVFEPRARATHEHLLDLAALERRNRTVARAWVRFFRKHPETLEHPYWRRFAARTRASIDAELVRALPERAQREAAARELARIDLGALERGGPRGARAASSIAAALRTELCFLNELWWCEGQLQGLEEFGVDSFRELAEARASDAALAAWPLASARRERLIAWPRYGESDDLERLLEAWADALLDQPDRCLCLRHDPEHDGDLEAAVERLTAVFERVVGAGRELDVLMVDGPIPDGDLPRLGRAVRAVLAVPGQRDPLRAAWAAKLGVDTLADPALLAG